MEIALKHLEKQFPNGTTALNNVTFTVFQGEFVSVIGASGAGKTTLFRILNGMDTVTSGTLLFDGNDVSTITKREQKQIRRSIGTIYQDFCLVENSTCLANVLTACLPDMNLLSAVIGLYSREQQNEALSLLKRVGLEEKAEEPVKNLSGGQKQRVAIAGVMAMKPQCIILDEPTAMLDPNGRREVIRTVRQLNESQGVTVLLITHYMEEATWADRIIVMDDGKIVMDGKPREIFSRVRELKECGLDVPQATELAFELKEAGMPLPDGILSREELAEELERILEPSARTQGSGKETGEKDVH